MDVASSIGAVFAAVGLSAAAGLNAYLPLLMGAVLERTDVVELGDPFGALSSNGGIAVLAALLLADLVGDKIPGVDHVLHLVGVVVAPVAGAILFVGQTGIETGIPAAVAAILGAATAETLILLRGQHDEARLAVARDRHGRFGRRGEHVARTVGQFG